MSTRGLVGIRMAGADKLVYNHFDSYPEGLGHEILTFCSEHTTDDFKKAFGNMYQISGEREDMSSGMEALVRAIKEPVFCERSNAFILDSLTCEYAYIINLDTGMLEYWKGFQKQPDVNNRYGCTDFRGYFPCKKICEFSLRTLFMYGPAFVPTFVKAMTECKDPGKKEFVKDEPYLKPFRKMIEEFGLTVGELQELSDFIYDNGIPSIGNILGVYSRLRNAVYAVAFETGIINKDNAKYFASVRYAADLAEGNVPGYTVCMLSTGKVVVFKV